MGQNSKCRRSGCRLKSKKKRVSYEKNLNSTEGILTVFGMTGLFAIHANNNRLTGTLAYWILGALSLYVLTPTLSQLLFRSSDMFSSSSKRSDKHTTGLINNRNDCFANASVQALAALPKLSQYMNDFMKSVSLIGDMLNNENEELQEEVSPAKNDDAVQQRVKSANALDHDLLTPKVEIERNPFSMGHDILTPKAELDENPMENLSSLDGMVEKQDVSRVKSSNTLSTLQNESNLSDHAGAISTADVSLNQEFNGTDDTRVTSAHIPETLMHQSLAKILAQLQETLTSSRHISVWPLLRTLEIIFKAKISTGQNDAHELTQIILETLEKENSKLQEFAEKQKLAVLIPQLPFKGKIAGHLACLKCGEFSKVNVHPFNIYPLHVPQSFSANLADMVADNQTETIEGYSCLVCKVKAILNNEKGRNYENCSPEEMNIIKTLENALPNLLINDDISQELSSYIDSYNKDGVVAKDIKSTIVKKTVVVNSPEILVLHLSRSMFNGVTYSRNSCGVAFEETLQCVEQVIENNKCVGTKTINYKLKAIVKHSGSHSQGHYECYRHKPDFVKDTVSKQVINRAPLIDVSLLNAQDNKAEDGPRNQALEGSSNGAHADFAQQVNNSQGNFTLNSDALAPNLQPKNSSEDDYVISTGADSSRPSRKPSTLQKITGFLSRRSSITNADEQKGDPSSLSSVSLSRSSSAATSVNRSRSNSVITSEPVRSRAGSIATSSNGRGRGNSISSLDSQSSFFNSSDTNVGSTSASEIDNNTTESKRVLKKIKSVSKYPFWHISDTDVKEAKADEVLSEMRYVYMLYYERIA